MKLIKFSTFTGVLIAFSSFVMGCGGSTTNQDQGNTTGSYSLDTYQANQLSQKLSDDYKTEEEASTNITLMNKNSDRPVLKLLGALLPPANLKSFRSTSPTRWKPEGTRQIRVDSQFISNGESWVSRHADLINSDEISTAVAPELSLAWVADIDKYYGTSFTADRNGNIYGAPVWAGDQSWIVSYEKSKGNVRFRITKDGVHSIGDVPLILNDEDDSNNQIIYSVKIDEAIAVSQSGQIIWRKPTHLPGPAADEVKMAWGPNYHTEADALVSVTGDGDLIVLDRKSGTNLLSSAYQIPGAIAPEQQLVNKIPEFLIDRIGELLSPLVPSAPTGIDFKALVNGVLGSGFKVVNYFSIEPVSGTIWVAGTLPDEDDGVVDGISENGAVYALILVKSNGKYQVQEKCHIGFEGGSGSSPALGSSHVYVGNSTGDLVAYDFNCNRIWSIHVGATIAGSPTVAKDNGEIYVVTMNSVSKIVDHGSTASLEFQADVNSIFRLALRPGFIAFNTLTATLSANTLSILAGAGPQFVTDEATFGLPYSLAIAHIDRRNGSVTFATEAREESIATLPAMPGGELVVPSSPIRRAIVKAIFPNKGEPLTGGIQLYRATKIRPLLRDAMCSAASRTQRARSLEGLQPEGTIADIKDIAVLLQQALKQDYASSVWPGMKDEINKVLSLQKAFVERSRFASAKLALSEAKLAALCSELK